MNSVEENLRLIKTLDDAWNSQDWATFEKIHANHVEVFWLGQPEPTKGRYRSFSVRVNGHCSVADFTGTFKGPMTGTDGKMIQLTGKKFKVEFCSVAHWINGEIVEEKHSTTRWRC